MPICGCSIARRAVLGLAAVLAMGGVSARATPYLVADADSDQVLIANEATEPWYPASLTKLMTVYVALDAVRNGKLTMDTPLVMSAAGGANAALEDGVPAGHPGDARQRAQDADGEVPE